ncbi:MAG: hypothetical protein U5L72_10065 [Bacteroidales bacterium]|nr:hypothetical protein [Bacteroidales bacterium]
MQGLLPACRGRSRIITLTHDTIACRITKITRSDIHFDVYSQGIMTSGRMPLAGILSYSVSPAKSPPPLYEAVSSGSPGRLRLGLNGGMGYIISSSDAAEDAMVSLGLTEAMAESYYSDLKSGWYGNADATWLINDRFGAGLKYKFFNTSAETEGYFDPGDTYTLYFATFRENIFVNYAGVLIFYQEPIGKKGVFSLYSTYSLGMAFYRNEFEFFYGNMLITGNALGMDGSLGMEYRITPLISAGTELSIFSATIRKVNITDGEMNETMELEKDNYENLSRVELSLGIRFYFGRR